MRLTHLKLAGFKSFVDPTTLHIHGQRVGVVGPNGCGKSNVMESIRWVLGESSAKEMRGDSMQDVIFNGSGNRKPVSRASVELIFDNSLGTAAGEWAQYAEISVKRVLQRDSGSSYYINNTHVRRRDVADLFLGTGLGGRAYAIIGQNTISRIVEARPEELRVFLEEAAGISKYKERRRETELRLRDTRENLLRVDDIRQELDKQITRLESQAQVAQQYHELQKALAFAKAQLWWIRKQDAAQAWEKSQRQVERLAADLEAQVAQLRAAENQLETLRQAHHEAGDQVQVAQGRFYEANAAVSTLEQQIRHLQENRDRLVHQIAQLEAEQQQAAAQLEAHTQQLQQLETELQGLRVAAEQAEAALQHTRAQLPAAEQAFRDQQAAFSDIQHGILQAEQQLQLERTHLDHARRQASTAEQQMNRLREESGRLELPSQEALEAGEAKCLALQATLNELETALAKLGEQEQQLEAIMRTQQQTLYAAERGIAHHEAQMSALSKMQQSRNAAGDMGQWLSRHARTPQSPLWQMLDVESGWETALEGALGIKLNALEMLPETMIQKRPPAAAALFRGGNGDAEAAPHPKGWRSLISIVRIKEAHVAGPLAEWLAGHYLLEPGLDAEQARQGLREGEVLVNREGDVLTTHGVILHAAQPGTHGVLERQRELEQLQAALPGLRQSMAAYETALKATEQSLADLRAQGREKRELLRQQTAGLHAARLDSQRLQQQQQHALERRQRLEQESEQVTVQREGLLAQIAQHQQHIAALQTDIDAGKLRREQAGQHRQAADTALKQVREMLIEAERNAQKQTYEIKIVINNINEINSRIKVNNDSSGALAGRLNEARGMLQETQAESARQALEQSIAERQQLEAVLVAAREVLSGVEQQLLETERVRLQTEQQLHPLRDKLEQARLHAQELRLTFEHAVEQLQATGMAEQSLGETLPAGTKATHMEQRIVAIDADIATLGAVNLAAIQELAIERERKTYLDNQAQDLESAVATLEDAIRRIDRETRSRLQHTFDEANRHFGELFMTLFGGGQAQLQLLGEEILDTGIQVFAQPPGKKNSTIHLLSGGEKALTALALVFALFRLNPAPFCLMDEVDAPLDDSNTERFCSLVRKMSERTQFMFVSHNKITMEMAQQLVGVTMQESGVSRIVEVDIEAAMRMQTELALDV